MLRDPNCITRLFRVSSGWVSPINHIEALAHKRLATGARACGPPSFVASGRSAWCLPICRSRAGMKRNC